MTAEIYIDNDFIGEVILKVIDRSMGVVGGEFLPTILYGKYRSKVQDMFQTDNSSATDRDFNFRAFLEGVELKAVGGICVTDAIEYDELPIEICGIDSEIVDRIVKSQTK